MLLKLYYLKHLFKYRFSTVQYCRIEKKDSLKCMSITVNKIFLNNQWESIDEMIDILKKNNVDIEFELVEENEKNDI